MELPQLQNRFDMFEPSNELSGADDGRKGLRKKAGHILLGAPKPHATIPMESIVERPARIEHSAWHSIPLNQLGEVVTQEYGKAFQDELKVEQMMNAVNGQQPAANTPAMPVPIAQPVSDAPHAESVVPLPQLNSQLSQGNPIFNTIPERNPSIVRPLEQHSVQFQEVDRVPIENATPQNQELSYAPLGRPEGQNAFSQPTMQGAINPSSQPLLTPAPQTQDPRLMAGTPLPMDPQHLLPSSTRKKFFRFLKSPWFWLLTGIVMILYFAGSL